MLRPKQAERRGERAEQPNPKPRLHVHHGSPLASSSPRVSHWRLAPHKMSNLNTSQIEAHSRAFMSMLTPLPNATGFRLPRVLPSTHCPPCGPHIIDTSAAPTCTLTPRHAHYAFVSVQERTPAQNASCRTTPKVLVLGSGRRIIPRRRDLSGGGQASSDPAPNWRAKER
jgi:hypothetical protein